MNDSTQLNSHNWISWNVDYEFDIEIAMPYGSDQMDLYLDKADIEAMLAAIVAKEEAL